MYITSSTTVWRYTFSGMSYPWGTCGVYRLPAVAHVYSPGHCLSHTITWWVSCIFYFFSFITTPLFFVCAVPAHGSWALFCIFCFVGYSPAFATISKINAGHHGCLWLPDSVFRYCLRSVTLTVLAPNRVYCFLYHCLLFLLHPYMGFSIAIFSFMSALIFKAWAGKQKRLFKTGFVLSPVVPVAHCVI